MTKSGPRQTGSDPAATTISAGRLSGLLALACCGAALVALPAAADWLVMKDGSRLETRGPWSVEGRRVLFNLPNGTLSTLRASEVDLDASEALTRAKEAESVQAAEAAEMETAAPTPVWTFTNDDIPRAVIVQEDLEIEPLVGAEGFALEDVEEDVDATGENLVVSGTLINDADIPASLVAVRVLIVSPVDGGTLDVASAIVNSTQLLPRSATRFTASFENLAPGLGVVQVEVEVAEEQDDDFGFG